MDPADHKPSGWYPDESNSSQQRWWNGISWGDQTRPANQSKPPLTVPMTTPRPVDPYAQSAPTPPPASTPTAARDGQFRRLNPIGYAGIVLGLISLLFNVFCIPSILAIIFSSIGLVTARRLRASGGRAVGWSWCVAGLVLGTVETGIYLATTVQ